MIPQQLSLGVSLNDDARFDNFYIPAAGAHAQIVHALKNQINSQQAAFIFLWGAPGCGLTHLLQAACHFAAEQGKSFQYFPLKELLGYSPTELFAELESLDFVCVDSFDLIAGKPEWEQAFFHFFNASRDAGKALLVAGIENPRNLLVQLPDLKSRLLWGEIFHLEHLNDLDKIQALKLRAKRRGLDLSDEVANYLIQRLPRDMNELFFQLNKLDQASLAEQRRLTIPFVKKILNV